MIVIVIVISIPMTIRYPMTATTTTVMIPLIALVEEEFSGLKKSRRFKFHKKLSIMLVAALIFSIINRCFLSAAVSFLTSSLMLAVVCFVGVS